jgi:hypothetical protein
MISNAILERVIKAVMMSKRQKLLILLSLLLPLLINIFAIVREVDHAKLTDSVMGTYKRFGLPYNPWPDILISLTGNMIVIGLFSWLIAFALTRSFVRKLAPAIRYGIILIASLSGAYILAIWAGIILPLVWLPQFGDYLLGLPGSEVASRSAMPLVFPIEFAILLLASLNFKPNSLSSETIRQFDP